MRKYLIFFVVLLIALSNIKFDKVVIANELTMASVVNSFDFMRELFGNLSSLSVWIVNIDNNTGEVYLNGIDTQRPVVPFTWDWGDNTVFDGWFPQNHTYIDKTKNYIVCVTAHYPDGTIDSTRVVVRFLRLNIMPINLSPKIDVIIASQPVDLSSRMQGYDIPEGLTYFNDNSFGLINRSTVEYILMVAASIQSDFVNDNMYSIDGLFRQVLLRDPTFGGMYSLWYTNPIAIGAGDFTFEHLIQWSSIFHEMGHNFVLNSPSNYTYGGKIDGNANAIFTESMAQIFQHATAYELINNAAKYGLSADIVCDIQQSAIQTMRGVRSTYLEYINAGMKYSSWNDPVTDEDESFNTFITIAYEFFLHAEKSELGYRIPLKRMMSLLQTFDSDLKRKYSQYENTQVAESFRATLMVAALSYAFGEDLRVEFRALNFPISDEEYNGLMNRMQLTMSLSASSILIGTAVTISGALDSVGTGMVSIYTSFGGSSFVKITDIDLSDGTYSYSFMPTEIGTYLVRADCPGDDTHAATSSSQMSFTVTKITPTISLSLSSTSVKVGDSITASGTISPFYGSTTVNLIIMAPDGTTTPATVTSTDGTFSYAFTGNVEGSYGIQASILASDFYEEVQSSTIYVQVEKKCIIATATFGSELSPEVSFLRDFRNDFILKTYAGSKFYVAFDAFYYSWSTPVAVFIDRQPIVKAFTKLVIYPLIGALELTAILVLPWSGAAPEVAAIVAGFMASCMIGLIYFFPPIFACRYAIKRIKKIRPVTGKFLKYNAFFVLITVLGIMIGVLANNASCTTIATSLYVISNIVLTNSVALYTLERKMLHE